MRILNDLGRKYYSNWCINLYENKTNNPSGEQPPSNILNSEDYSFELKDVPDIQFKEFKYSFELSEYVYNHYNNFIAPLKLPPENWGNLMDTYSLIFFELICEKKDAVWVPRKEHFYIYTKKNQRGYITHRHRIFGPFIIYSVSKNAARKILGSKPPYQLGDIEENIGCDNHKVTNKALLDIIAKLYFTSDGKQIPGIMKKIKKTKWEMPGNLKRFKSFYNQFNRTYDLLDMSEEAFLQLLPSEFDDWLSHK